MYDEAWNEGKLDVVDEICAPDYVGEGPYGDEHGPESVKSGILTRRQAFPDIHATIEDIIASEDKVVARLTFRGTHKGEFLGVNPLVKKSFGRESGYIESPTEGLSNVGITTICTV